MDNNVAKENSVLNLIINLVATQAVNVLMMALIKCHKNVIAETHLVQKENIALTDNVAQLETRQVIQCHILQVFFAYTLLCAQLKNVFRNKCQSFFF